ncbi:hypothetical protein Vretifemale_12606 [Volvox reticuliferus]|uniref:Uncharacterized protein n=1 Tax=Volvox reticuliferus TaxID=1737510 RepID=A0A8J4CRY8_9CHLO|nr:hypothetical protein Vretifemale_12606 [Volvox reticuliferus]
MTYFSIRDLNSASTLTPLPDIAAADDDDDAIIPTAPSRRISPHSPRAAGICWSGSNGARQATSATISRCRAASSQQCATLCRCPVVKRQQRDNDPSIIMTEKINIFPKQIALPKWGR